MSFTMLSKAPTGLSLPARNAQFTYSSYTNHNWHSTDSDLQVGQPMLGTY